MDYYSSNMEIIKKHRKLLYDDIIAIQDSNCDSNYIFESIVARDGNFSLVIQKDDKQYRMNSIYRPCEESKKWVEQFDFNNLMMIISMYGFGNGYFIREIMNKLKKDDKFLVYEPCIELFIHVINAYDIVDILKNEAIFILVGEKGKKQFHDVYATFIHWSNVKSSNICIHPQYDILFSNELIYFGNAIAENLERVTINRNFENTYSKETIDNLLCSMGYMRQSNFFEELKNLWDDDIPVIIVASGPSLDINIGELKKAKGKSFIIAADSALPSLYKNGIVPDIVVTVDPKKGLKHFIDVGFEELSLICTTYSRNQIIKMHNGKKIWFGCHEYIIQLFKKLGKNIHSYNAGASVATIAFTVAKELNTKTIILIGQDLAYKDGMSHSGNILRKQKGSGNDCFVEGIDGKSIRTREDWKYYITWYERTILEELNENTQVIDATEGGARIRGTTLMTLKEAINAYCMKSIDITRILRELNPNLNSNEYDKMIEYIEDDMEDLSKLIRITNDSLELCDKIIKSYKMNKIITSNMGKYIDKIINYNKSISSMRINLLVEELVKGKDIEMLQTIGSMTDNEYDNFLSVYEKQKQMLKDLNESTILLKPMLRECIYDMKSKR